MHLHQTVIFWFRKDLRLTDNIGLHKAAQAGKVLPLYIFDKSINKEGQAVRWWLYHALKNLQVSLNNNLQFYVDTTEHILLQVCKKYKINKIYCNKVYEPAFLHLDALLEKKLAQHDIEFHVAYGNLLWQPEDVCKSDGTYYKVFTPFFQNGCLKSAPPAKPLAIPSSLEWFVDKDYKNQIDELFSPLFGADWYKDRKTFWDVSEKGALQLLSKFLHHNLSGYDYGRDFPAQRHTSMLSAYLQIGQISPRTMWYQSVQAYQEGRVPSQDSNTFLRELGWREFSYNLLHHFPQLPDKNFQPKFDNFVWQGNEKLLHAWQYGQTGYPIVDAGMRELLETGHMHNRVRMIVASFLVKNLLLDWRYGRDWFWDRLVDADLASNSMNWQWVAGCGVDAAPYFRIFNPITQGEKFDAKGEYTRQFVPELAKLPDKFLFEPWKASPLILMGAGVNLGKNYPMPIVDLQDSRKKALHAYHNL